MTTEQTAQQTENGNAVEAQAAQQEKMIPESRLNNLIQQISELRKFKETVDEQARIESEKKAIAAQEFEKVLSARESEKAELAKQLDVLKRQNEIGKVERALLASGVSDDLARDGLMTRFERDKPEDVTAWIAAQKQSHPSAFTAAPTPMSSGPAGNVASGSPNTLEQRLNASDAKIRSAARLEKLKLDTGLV